MTEVIYDPLEDTVVVTIGTERILMLDNQGQVECNENKTVKDLRPETRPLIIGVYIYVFGQSWSDQTGY